MIATRRRRRPWLALVAVGGMLAGAGGASAATVTEFSAGITTGSRPEGITAGPDSNLWFTEFDGDRIGRITPTGVVTEFSAGITPGSSPNGITAGPDNNLWFTEFNGGRVARITPAGVVTEFPVAGSATSLNGITTGPDGNLWYAADSHIGRVTPTGVVTQFSAGISADSSLEQITTGPDGNLWFTANGGSRVGRVTPAGTVTEFPTGLGANVSSDIVAGPDRNLWFTAGSVGGSIGRITPAGSVTEFRVSRVGTLPGIAAGPDGNLWFTSGAGVIGRATPAGAVNLFSAGISSGSSPSGITGGPDGNLWFTERFGNRIGRITTDVAPAGPVTALPTPALGRRVNVQVVRGQVLVSVPAGGARTSAVVPGLKGRNFVPLRGSRQIPVGSVLDTRKGTVRLTSARDSRGTTQNGDFAAGVFQVLQSRAAKAKGLTELRLKGASFKNCTTRRAKRATTSTTEAQTAARRRRLSRRTVRRLRANAKGRFRTRGRYSSATVRGTTWTTTDRCDGTLTKVTRGRVTVRDLRRRKNITLRTGKSYLARARR